MLITAVLREIVVSVYSEFETRMVKEALRPQTAAHTEEPLADEPLVRFLKMGQI